MRNRKLALAFINCFCAGDIDGLASMLHPDFQFIGPLFTADSAEDYLTTLRADPPERSLCDIHSVTENDSSVAVFYRYEKLSGDLEIAQLFQFTERLISGIRLIFDSQELTR